MVLSQSSLKAIITQADYPSNTAIFSYMSQCHSSTGRAACYANATDSGIACEMKGLSASTKYDCLAVACILPGSGCGYAIRASASTAPEGKILSSLRWLLIALNSLLHSRSSTCIDKNFRRIRRLTGCDCHSPS